MLSPLSFIWANMYRSLNSTMMVRARQSGRHGKQLLSTSASVANKCNNKVTKNGFTMNTAVDEVATSLSALSIGLLLSVSPLFILLFPSLDMDNDGRTKCEEQEDNKGKQQISFRQRRLTQVKIIPTPPKSGSTNKQQGSEVTTPISATGPTSRMVIATEIDENDTISIKNKKTAFQISNNMNVAAYSCHGLEPFTPSSTSLFSFPNNGNNDDIYSDQEILSSSLSNILGYIPNSIVPSAFAMTAKLNDNNNAMISQLTCNKINQDRGNVVTLIPNHLYMMAVYDGHGTCGDLLAQFVMEKMTSKMKQHCTSTPSTNNNPIPISDAVLTEFCSDMDNELAPDTHPFSSGTTACILLYQPQQNQLIAANVGDSRAVIGSLTAKKRTTAIPKNHYIDANRTTSNNVVIKAKLLTTDQKPGCPRERQRVLDAGGYVTIDSDTRYPARIWSDKKCTQVGLAMSRSIGDFVLKAKGVISTPVITKHSISPQDQFLILATDGVWEFISSQEAVEIIHNCKFNYKMNVHEACQYLINTAKKRWEEEEGNYRDDITAIVLDFQNN